ncbi:MAG TPA: bifunctional hydroxymethylpyrimidine kinase/phosphomethylpyrimidine kinase [Chloroflexota bacterium]|jgi:hydroxymethylpyrimidine/phosphomethylpyrimidine kinase
MSQVATALTIAGSDSGGGAGIQADLKTFSALGVFGTSAITAVTVQNTRTVSAFQVLDLPIIRGQIEAVLDDIGADAVKTGMLGTAAVVETVAGIAATRGLPNLVVDPVMVAKSGDLLLEIAAVEAYRRALVPRALVLTPNHGEAEAIVGRAIAGGDDVRKAAGEIVAMGARWVVMKGGHRPGPEVVDVLHDGREFWELRSPRIETTSTHGTGCTFASAIAARLALGDEVPSAVRFAHDYLHEAIVRARPIGHGHGPVHHFHRWY